MQKLSRERERETYNNTVVFKERRDGPMGGLKKLCLMGASALVKHHYFHHLLICEAGTPEISGTSSYQVYTSMRFKGVPVTVQKSVLPEQSSCVKYL